MLLACEVGTRAVAKSKQQIRYFIKISAHTGNAVQFRIRRPHPMPPPGTRRQHALHGCRKPIQGHRRCCIIRSGGLLAFDARVPCKRVRTVSEDSVRDLVPIRLPGVPLVFKGLLTTYNRRGFIFFAAHSQMPRSILDAVRTADMSPCPL